MERKKILLIEDEVKLARFVELELKYEGYDVTTCHDGRVGMEMITNQEFDMILLDLIRRIVFDNPPLIAGTAKMITPIRSTITPRFFNNSFMVIDILYIIFFLPQIKQ